MNHLCKLLLLAYIFSACTWAYAMQATPIMSKHDIKRYVDTHDWQEFVKALKNQYVRPIDMAEYSKDLLDQPYMSNEPSSTHGKTLFQALFCQVYSNGRSENHYKLLEGLIIADKITHNADLALTAIFPMRSAQNVPHDITMQFTKVLCQTLHTSPIVQSYNQIIYNIGFDITQIQKYLKAKAWQKLVHYTFERNLGTEFFINLPSNSVQRIIRQFTSEIGMPTIPPAKKEFFILLRYQLTLLSEKGLSGKRGDTDKNTFVGLPVIRESQDKNSLLTAIKVDITPYKVWITLACIYLGVKYYQRVASGRAKHAQNMIINQACAEITVTDDEGLQTKISSDYNSTTQLLKTTGVITLEFSTSDKNSGKALRIDLSKYEDYFDDYYINITISKTRWYERLFIKTSLRYSINWKQKPTTT